MGTDDGSFDPATWKPSPFVVMAVEPLVAFGSHFLAMASSSAMNFGGGKRSVGVPVHQPGDPPVEGASRLIDWQHPYQCR
jgi:hypothetical protein